MKKKEFEIIKKKNISIKDKIQKHKDRIEDLKEFIIELEAELKENEQIINNNIFDILNINPSEFLEKYFDGISIPDIFKENENKQVDDKAEDKKDYEEEIENENE